MMVTKYISVVSTAAILFICFMTIAPVFSQQSPVILPLKDQAEVIGEWMEERIEHVLPMLMRREQIDMWIIIAREYNEDPVIKSMLPPTWLAARRRTILVMYDQGSDQGIECLAVARYDVGKTFKSAWNPDEEPDQWKALADLISARNPNRIGLNISNEFALADGLSHSEYLAFVKYLPESMTDRVVSAEGLAIGWLETRTPSEMVVYEQICRIAHNIIAEGMSEVAVQPGVTSTEDLVWWFREKIRSLGLETWFHPTVAIQRENPERFDHLRSFSKRPEKQIIMPGDLLHCDVGITYLRLNTDTQQHAYVLKPGETDVPESLKKALATGNRAQDILTMQFKTGKTGNEILHQALEIAKKEGIKATIYTHPIGYQGHGAGTTIGLWDQQGGVPVKGDYPLYSNTAHSIELNVAVPIAEWGGKEIRIMLEEEAFFDGERVRYMDGRQRTFHLIPRPGGINKQ